MFDINSLKQIIEALLNNQLYEVVKNKAIAEGVESMEANIIASKAMNTSPFKIFGDLGEMQKSFRNLNTVFTKRFGVLSVLNSNNTSIKGLQIYNATVSVELIVNMDRSLGDSSGEFDPVKMTRMILDGVSTTYSGVTQDLEINGTIYAVTTVFTLSNTGTFEAVSSELGKVLPMSFTCDVSVVETGINSSSISLTINGDEVYASQIAEDMVISAEGQTRMGKSLSTFNAQEAKYSLSFVMPLTSSALSNMFLTAMHNGKAVDENGNYLTVAVKYGSSETTYTHHMMIASVRLTAQIPNNAGLNIELVDIDVISGGE